MADTTTAPAGDLRPAKSVTYCGVCSLPPEYCEYGGTTKKCQEWLEKNQPALYSKLYSDEALSTNLSTLSVDAQKRAEKDAIKKAAKAEAQEKKAAEDRASSKVYIKRVERNKRKYVTEVSGLENFGLDLKKTAKEFGKKFATGSSVTKTASGGEEITIQGDVSDDVVEWLEEHHEEIPEDNIEQIEDKKKKAPGPPLPPPQ
ncbi:Translation machinery-associated protein 22 [Fulvia fulva]|uniref:Translation machinery-associated protein 22 n=1 Tax=Passalora fulva TaxID=5499 RepID=A0A9Q8L7Y8_PASFU|nr:Translation machinery-associated protein 22 [Fulvia fulva]KAK4636270.1 Translation machinery-associated protein 22 [Fulvia fulva]KAK4637247.1 Translation machinery-associated protein 22 [Fulvia fulva]UJO12461.1 Translation machinery-associated protein 22 [Fulvia fulva]WPV08738.1 Translation machinery-associated protein 22 [Fulvia fulva]WPV24450.1 Translation machinery-associated protein 22 [Fulvia fulva]